MIVADGLRALGSGSFYVALAAKLGAAFKTAASVAISALAKAFVKAGGFLGGIGDSLGKAASDLVDAVDDAKDGGSLFGGISDAIGVASRSLSLFALKMDLAGNAVVAARDKIGNKPSVDSQTITPTNFWQTAPWSFGNTKSTSGDLFKAGLTNTPLAAFGV